MQGEPRFPPIRVVFAAPPDEGVAGHVGRRADVDCEVLEPTAGIALDEAACRADILVTRSSQRIDARVVQRAGKAGLRAIVQASSGADNIDLQRARDAGIEVVLVDPGNATAVAELTLLGLLAAFRGAREHWDATAGGTWSDREKVTDRELRGKALGLVGLGRVGSRVATRARAFEMDVLGVDPYVADDRFERFGVRRVRTVDDLCSRVDALSLHCPLTDETREMVGRRQLTSLRTGAVFVNTARAPIVDRDALRDVLDSGHLRAAVLDVHDPEPVEPGGLASHPRVLATPHIGGHTVESHAERARSLAAALDELIDRLAAGRGGRP